MKWLPDGDCAYTCDGGRFTLSRAPQAGWPATYTMVEWMGGGGIRVGNEFKRTGGKGEIIGVERDVSEVDSEAAKQRLYKECYARIRMESVP